MVLTRQEMEAKLEALEDRVALLSQVVDTLEDRFQLKMEQWTDWLRVHRNLLDVMDREMARLRGKGPGPTM